ncbi:hypothetical protein FRC12_024725 [Ceratobasidium sp. 428]|nr:hypothetical protein FRC12_024725 [Ceratobasidium sp. 428]
MSFAKTGSFLPASLVPSANNCLGSSWNNRIQDPHKIGYPKGWRTGDTEKWYKDQPTKKFTHLQYRKERDAPFYHEYIVLELDNNTVCRFDRRGDVATRAGAFTFEGMTAEDTAHVIQKKEEHYANIEAKSDMLLRIHFPDGQDLLTVLAVCYGVQKDDHTRAYTLTRYNCYFLSWIIITATARRTVDWALLSKDTNKWEELVRTTIEGLNTKQSSIGDRVKEKARALFGQNDDTRRSSGLDSLPFVGATYLISTLRKALFSTRSTMQQSLGQLILQKTVEPAMRQISYESAEHAAGEAARNHASQAARDAAMEAVIETMWRKILASENGGQLWEDLCKAAEAAVLKAAAAAADADEESDEQPVPENGSMKWEIAWDKAWSDSWKKPSADVEDGVKQISMRAKEAWFTAWEEACNANEEYVPLVSEGVAEFVIKNLPDSLPEVLKIDMAGTKPKLHALFAALSSDPKNSKLQEYIEGQIKDLCQRARTVGITQTPEEIEEAMRRVWVETVKALDSDSN